MPSLAKGEEDDLNHYLLKLQTGIRKLKEEITGLKATNDDLIAELEIARATSRQGQQTCSTDGDMDLEDLRQKDLARTVQHLRSENRRLARRIEKFKHKQLQDEIDALHDSEQSDANGDDTDSVAYMRKLLREVSDLMLVTTLRADMVEDCTFCSKKLAIKKCSALPCGHLICNLCVPWISKGADETVKCTDAECERVFPRDELELVHYTEQERWDQLLLHAQAWTAFDRRGEMETSEEEAEENFLTDGNGTSDLASEEGNYNSRTIDDKSSGGATADDSSEHGRSSYLESPTKLKRKRMEELAEQRSKRKRT